MERLFGSIPDILKGLGHDGGASEALVLAAWKQSAGELISNRTIPLEFFEHRLIVAVSDATWRTHLEDLAGQLVARLNSTLQQGTVKFIEFRIDPAAFEQSLIEPAEREPMAVPHSLKAAAEAIDDKELRERFLSTAAVYLDKK